MTLIKGLERTKFLREGSLGREIIEGLDIIKAIDTLLGMIEGMIGETEIGDATIDLDLDPDRQESITKETTVTVIVITTKTAKGLKNIENFSTYC